MQELLKYSLSFFSLYSRENEQREKARAVRTEHQCTLALSSLTTSMGGLGYCEFGVKYFKGVLEWGWAPRLSSVCVSERWSTPGSQPFLWLDEGLYPMPRGPPWLICSLFNDWPIARDNILWARLFLAKPPQADLCVSFFKNEFVIVNLSVHILIPLFVFRCAEEQIVLWSPCQGLNSLELA